MDDGKYYASIVDVIVLPEYQNQGIGKEILSLLKSELDSYLFITLTSAPGKDTFYKKQGWLKQKSAYIWPKSETQKIEYCENS